MSSLEQDLSRALAELQALERILSDLRSRVELLKSLLSEYDGALALLDELKEKGSNVNMLIPIGGGNFIQAEVKKVEDVHVSLGAGVVIRQPLKESYDLIKQRRERISMTIRSHEETIANYSQRAEELRRLVQALYARLAERQKAGERE
ncbi:MAG: prefoldin subunit alpha [Thaumarchaeota archaeon]|nr:prefoldin subunit alpha [Nitrososphaerota archaeon]